MKGKLKQLAALFAASSGAEVKVFVDTAPVMEKPLAAAAGIGWQGKHTNLVSREHGSWLFLGAIFTTAELAPDAPEADHCGYCRRCLDICPTQAFPAPYVLDARRCLAYLSIEHKGHIPAEFRGAMGNRVFGCDDCLAVCPWNKFAEAAREARFAARAETDNPPLAELLALDDRAFRARFAGTPVKRTGRDRFLRNVLIAAGNSGDASLLAARRGAACRRFAARARHGRVGDTPAHGRCGRRALAPPSPRARGRRRRARGMAIGTMTQLFCFGLGYSARALAHRLKGEGWHVTGTARTRAGADALAADGFDAFVFDGSAPGPGVDEATAKATHILVSAPPDADGDPVLRHYVEDLWQRPLARLDRLLVDHRRLRRPAGRLGRRDDPARSDVGAQPPPRRGRGGMARVRRSAQARALRFSASPASTGPGAAPFSACAREPRSASSRPGQVFNRIHVDDIAAALCASIGGAGTLPGLQCRR